jgi:N-methylhydantoinase B
MNAEAPITRWADPVGFELIQHALAAVAEQMAVTVVRTARSTVSKEVMDFSTALCNARGELVAQGFCLPVMLGSIPAAMRAVLARFAGRIVPGDVYVLNDPYEGGSHLPDIFMFKPVFAGEVLCGFACVVTHHADIGGIAPGGISAAATEVYQEGLLIPPLRLYHRGEVNETLMTVIARNVRVSDKVIGDLSSQVSACIQAEEGLLKVVSEHGLEVVLRHMDNVLDYSERLTRDALRSVPDGEFSFEDALDDDGMTTSPIPIRVTVRKRGDELVADFSASGSQARAAINMTRSDTLSCLCFVTRCLLDPAIPNNEGCFRPLSVVTTPGTIVDALPPAAVASRVLTMFRVTDALFGALARFFPDRVPACGMAVDCSICVSGQDADRNAFVQLDWLAGSWGGRPYSDGIDHVSALASNISNTPVELIESESPLLVEEYCLVKDSEGAGRFRGGLAVTRTWRLLGVDEALLQVRSDRLKFAPYGLNGGQAGTRGRNVVQTQQGERAMPSKFQTPLREGERIRIQTAGTGGWGDPLEREPLRVAQDVQEGRVSLERAYRVYGVAIDAATMQVDSDATSELRRKLQSARANGEEIEL